jgi:siroheme synthase-like protein
VPIADPLYPVNLRLTGRRCVVIGGGSVALQKVRGLLAAGAVVEVIAPTVDDEVASLAVTVRRRAYERGDLVGAVFAVAATDDPDTNAAVFDEGEAIGVWVNAADDPAHCSATLPAVIRRGPLVIAVSTGGASPAAARWMREQLETMVGEEYGVVTELLAEARAELRARGISTEGLAWRDALDSGMLELVREGNLAEAKERLQACLSSSSA